MTGFVSGFNGREYCFYDDHMTVDGVSLRYSEMVDIEHVEGEEPSFRFTYGNSRFNLPYDPRDEREIINYFVKAAVTKPQFAEEQAVEPEPEPVETEAEPEPEPAEPEPEPEPVETALEPAKHKTSPGEKIGTLTGRIKSMPTRTLIIIAAVIAALIIAVVAFVLAGGKSVDGLHSRIKIETVEVENGEKYGVAVIEDDADVEDYALDFYKKFHEEDGGYLWVINKETDRTVMFANHGDEVLVCEFVYVEGEEEDVSLLGSGRMTRTWIMYPQNDELIMV